MPNLGHALRELALALWFGGGLAMLVATRAIFAGAPDRPLAGRISGLVLLRYQLPRGMAAVALGASALLGTRGSATLLGLFAIVLQLVAAPVDNKLRALRFDLAEAPPEDPRRRTFGALHGVSVLLLLAQIAAAGAGLALPRETLVPSLPPGAVRAQ